jgi:RimJ/RimL family protein N-acetyltransferase
MSLASQAGAPREGERMSDITLRPLSATDMEQVRLWRNAAPETLRTPFMLTAEQQQDYYRTVICDRRSTTRYWGFHDILPIKYPPEESGIKMMPWDPSYSCKLDTLVGYGGIENIQWESSTGEISVLIGPDYQGKGYGRAAVDAILDQAFNHLNLETVWGECYHCCEAVTFWEKLVQERGGYLTQLPMRKYWNGAYWHSTYFTFYKAKK